MSLAVQVLSDKGKGLGRQPSPYDVGFALMEPMAGRRGVKFHVGAGGRGRLSFHALAVRVWQRWQILGTSPRMTGEMLLAENLSDEFCAP